MVVSHRSNLNPFGNYPRDLDGKPSPRNTRRNCPVSVMLERLLVAFRLPTSGNCGRQGDSSGAKACHYLTASVRPPRFVETASHINFRDIATLGLRFKRLKLVTLAGPAISAMPNRYRCIEETGFGAGSDGCSARKYDPARKATAATTTQISPIATLDLTILSWPRSP